MEQFISKDMEQMDKLSRIRERELPALVFASFMQRVESKKAVIDSLYENASSRKEANRTVQHFIVMTLAEIVDGNLAVVQYASRNKGDQTMYLFVGTHWRKFDRQLFFDFVKEASIKMGLSEIYCYDPEFVIALNWRFMEVLSHYRTQTIPPGEIWVNMENGTLEIRDDGGVLFREHRKEDFFCYVLPYPYNPSAECPRWDAFLNKVLPEKEMQMRLMEYIGYCLTKDLKLEKMAVFYGVGANGKSVALDVIAALLGESNVSYVCLDDLTLSDEKRFQFENKLVNISSESGGKIGTAVLKQLISGETVVVHEMYHNSRPMTNYGKLITSYNILPDAEYSHGFYRRWALFPFKVVVPEQEQDINLTKKLRAELSGIFNLVLVALQRLLQQNAFTESAACTEALREYKRNSNSVNTFLCDACEFTDSATTKLADLYNAYLRYCRAEEDSHPYGKKGFGQIIRGLSGLQEKVSHHISYFNIKVSSE